LVEEKEAADAEAKRKAKDAREGAEGQAFGHSGNSTIKASRRFY